MTTSTNTARTRRRSAKAPDATPAVAVIDTRDVAPAKRKAAKPQVGAGRSTVPSDTAAGRPKRKPALSRGQGRTPHSAVLSNARARQAQAGEANGRGRTGDPGGGCPGRSDRAGCRRRIPRQPAVERGHPCTAARSHRAWGRDFTGRNATHHCARGGDCPPDGHCCRPDGRCAAADRGDSPPHAQTSLGQDCGVAARGGNGDRGERNPAVRLPGVLAAHPQWHDAMSGLRRPADHGRPAQACRRCPRAWGSPSACSSAGPR